MRLLADNQLVATGLSDLLSSLRRSERSFSSLSARPWSMLRMQAVGGGVVLAPRT